MADTFPDSELLEAIRKAGESQAIVLDLQGRGLKEMPFEVFGLKKLRKLNLNNNELTSSVGKTGNRLTAIILPVSTFAAM